MSNIDEKPGIDERYAAATTSSNLRCEARTAGPLDIIVSASWAREDDGRILSHAKNEFDRLHASIPPSNGRSGRPLSAADRRNVAIWGMQNWRTARDVVRRFATDRIERRGWEVAEDEAHTCAWQALIIFFDPKCPSCTGRGTLGGYDGTLQHKCTHCDPNHRGQRRRDAGNTDWQRDFIESLLTRIDTEVTNFGVAVSYQLRGS